MKPLLCSFIILLLLSSGIYAEKTTLTDLHSIDILNIFISDHYLSCNKNINAVIELRNTGLENEYVHIELINTDLNIDEFAPIFMIQPKKLASTTIPLTMQQEPEGTYEFEVIVYFSNEIKRSFKSFTFTGCPEPPQPQPLLDLASHTPKPQENKQLLSAQTIYIIIMLIIIFLLALIYLFKLFLEKSTRIQ